MSYNIPKKVSLRIKEGIKNYQSVLKSAHQRDVNESDTVTIVTDLLSDIFGYNKYHEITREFQIRGTYCDLATLMNGKVNLLLEVKAIGIDLKEVHIKQATDYAANEGVDWVILTNGLVWMIYKVQFTKPILPVLVYKFNFLELDYKKDRDIELLFPLTKEAYSKSTLEDLHSQKQILNKYVLASIIQSEVILSTIKREVKKISPNAKIENEDIKSVIISELIKRDVLESEETKEALKKLNKPVAKKLKTIVNNTTKDVKQEAAKQDEQTE